jgi:thiol-disulfide isomerase/thioredoxin
MRLASRLVQVLVSMCVVATVVVALPACRDQAATERRAASPAPQAAPAPPPAEPAPAEPAAPPRRPWPKVDVYGNPNQFEVPPFEIGDLAPALTATEWLGPPVESLRGRVHVVEFWATWCQPCQKSIPDLKRLARAHGDRIRVVGVAASEAGDAAGVREYAKRAGIDYTIAYADDEALFEKWMHAARVSGLPWVFIVDTEGRLAWWGQPFETEFEPTLRQVVSGRFDLAAMRNKIADRQRLDREGWDILQKVQRAAGEKKIDEALGMLDRLIALDAARFWYEVAWKFLLLLEKKDTERAYAYGRKIVAGASRDNPHALHDIGTAILDYPDPEGRDLKLARTALERGHQLTHGENPDILRSLARLRVLQGQKARARPLLERALRYAAPSDRPEIEKALASIGGPA